jgi:hypothetical protein
MVRGRTPAALRPADVDIRVRAQRQHITWPGSAPTSPASATSTRPGDTAHTPAWPNAQPLPG